LAQTYAYSSKQKYAGIYIGLRFFWNRLFTEIDQRKKNTVSTNQNGEPEDIIFSEPMDCENAERKRELLF
jgi:hypothetical protein